MWSCDVSSTLLELDGNKLLLVHKHAAQDIWHITTIRNSNPTIDITMASEAPASYSGVSTLSPNPFTYPNGHEPTALEEAGRLE
jgi:hypothetical protein